MTSRSHRQHAERARVLALIASNVILFGSALLNPAHAYVGQELLQWVGDNIIFPLGLIALIFSLAAALFRPDLVKQAVWATVICAVIFFLIRSAPQLQAALQAG